MYIEFLYKVIKSQPGNVEPGLDQSPLGGTRILIFQKLFRIYIENIEKMCLVPYKVQTRKYHKLTDFLVSKSVKDFSDGPLMHSTLS